MSALPSPCGVSADLPAIQFFYKNGVPKWRGTGYYYSRFRPTLLHTLTFLVLLTSLFHLLVMRLNFSRDRRRIEYFDRSAKAAAKRGQGKRERFDLQDVVSDGAGKGGEEFGRRVKVPMVEANDMGGLLELVVLDEKVYMVCLSYSNPLVYSLMSRWQPHDDGSLEPLSRLALSPSFFRTWPFLLARSLYTRILTRGQQAASHDSNGQVESDQSNGITAADAIQNARSGPNGTHPSVRKGKAKVTPVDTPETTDLDSEDENEEGSESPAPGANGEGKQKKKRGLGKAGGMRRRKMALKR